MESLTVLAIAFGIGVVDGLRSMTAPAVVAWAARLKWLGLDGTSLAWLSSLAACSTLTVLALAEMVGDKLPKTPSRKTPGPFVARVVLGAFSGAAVCMGTGQAALVGGILGAVGAVVGTLGGYEDRVRVVKIFGLPDLGVALTEDLLAIATGFFLVTRL